MVHHRTFWLPPPFGIRGSLIDEVVVAGHPVGGQIPDAADFFAFGALMLKNESSVVHMQPQWFAAHGIERAESSGACLSRGCLPLQLAITAGVDTVWREHIGAQDIVTLGGVSLETHGLLVQCFYPAAVITGHTRLEGHKQDKQTERGNPHGHGTFPNRSDFAILGYTQLMKNVISADRSDCNTRGIGAQGKKSIQSSPFEPKAGIIGIECAMPMRN